MVCPKCGSSNINFQAVAVQKKRGCLASALWLFLACITFFAIIWIPLLTRKGSKVRTFAVCQNCGKRWRAG